MTQSFSLTSAVRAGAVFPGGATQSERAFLDFVIDGEPLRPRVPHDVISVLATDLPAPYLATEVGSLLLETPAPLADGRRVIYSCPECGDLGCGGVTAEITIDGDVVTWRDFGWQTDYDPEVDLDEELGPFRFGLAEYRAALEPLRHST